ncbi:MAG: radical SAM protein [Acidobacteriaceae bacterium]
MKKSDIFRAWGTILAGRAPTLSIEITKECPLRCPGCYAFDAAHLGGGQVLRELSDYRGDRLVQGVLGLIDEHKPVHVSLVGGDPLVRYRELETLLPEIERRGVYTQIVTSAFRVIPGHWKKYRDLNVVISVDGLPAEHDARRKPATYERILTNIRDAEVTIHCTITAQIVERAGYLDEFLAFWSQQPQTAQVWFSIFTPQRGATDPEILSTEQRASVIEELRVLRRKYPILEMPDSLIDQFARPPHSPEECIFARTTETISADLKTRITPCQFGGQPDCSQCGCIASMALAAVGHHKLIGPLTAGRIFLASDSLGKGLRKLRGRSGSIAAKAPAPSPFVVLESSEEEEPAMKKIARR